MCGLFHLTSGGSSCLQQRRGKEKPLLGKLGSSEWLIGHAAVGLTLLLVGPIVGPWLFVNDSSEWV